MKKAEKKLFETKMAVVLALRTLKKPYKGVTDGKTQAELDALLAELQAERKAKGHVAFEVMYV